MDIKGKTHSVWTEKDEEEEVKDRYNLFSEWFGLFGANKQIIIERMPLFVKRKRGSKKNDTALDVSMGFRATQQHRARVDKICLTFRSKGKRIFETDADFNRAASEFFAMMIFNIMDEKEMLSVNEDVKFMDQIDYYTRCQGKISDAVAMLEGFGKMLKNETISEEMFVKSVETAIKNIPKAYRSDMAEIIKTKISAILGTYGKKLILRINFGK